VGDTLRDIEAGARTGVQGILVRTGYGAEAAAGLDADERMRKSGKTMPHRLPIDATGGPGVQEAVRPVHIAADLLAAVQWILRNRKP
jgi:hypothetical protein